MPAARGERGGEPGAAGAHRRCWHASTTGTGASGASRLDVALEVAVQQRVADDRPGGSRVTSTARRLGRARTRQRGVDGRAEHVDGDEVQLLHGARALRRVERDGLVADLGERVRAPAPVSAHTVRPHSCAALAAASTLGERPEVRQRDQHVARPAVRRAPGGRTPPRCRSRWRSPSGGRVAVQAIALSGPRSVSKRPTSSAVRCWASAALPPLPTASSRAAVAQPRGPAGRPTPRRGRDRRSAASSAARSCASACRHRPDG